MYNRVMCKRQFSCAEEGLASFYRPIRAMFAFECRKSLEYYLSRSREEFSRVTLLGRKDSVKFDVFYKRFIQQKRAVQWLAVGSKSKVNGCCFF